MPKKQIPIDAIVDLRRRLDQATTAQSSTSGISPRNSTTVWHLRRYCVSDTTGAQYCPVSAPH